LRKQSIDKEEELQEQIRSLTTSLRNQKDIAAKFGNEIMTWKRKLSAYANPESEKVPKKDVLIAEDRARDAEMRLHSLSIDYQAKIEEGNQLRKEITIHRRTEEELRATFIGLKAKVRVISDIEAKTMSIREKLKGSKCTVQSLGKELNILFDAFGIDRIELIQASRFWSLRTEPVFESPPMVLARLKEIGKLVRGIRNEMSRFPIPIQTGSSGEIEDELRMVIEMVRTVWTNQISQVKELKGIISSQHCAILETPR
jgi:hypothetical protein